MAAADPSTPTLRTWGHLSLVERLASGASGEVYRAWDSRLQCEVALKLLHADDSADDAGSSQIVQEAKLLAQVDHPHVITVHGVDQHDGRWGLWMQLIRGTTLDQLLASHGPLSSREAALIGIDLCGALAAIHGACLVHRDVKAQNVMREDGGRIVLMDLGIGRAAVAAGPLRFDDLAGTPLYLAPELFEGASVSARTDVYGLGVLLFYLVTQQFPVTAATLDGLREAHAKGTRLRLRDVRRRSAGGVRQSDRTGDRIRPGSALRDSGRA